MDERLERAIKNRDIIVSAYSLHLGKILDLRGMSAYKSICFNRVLDTAEKYDLNIFIDLIDGDLCLDRISVLFCQDIISGYLGEAYTDDLIKYLDSMCRISEMQTLQLTTLRKADIKTLKSALKNPPVYEDETVMQSWKEMIQLEIKCRNRLYLLYIAIKKSIWNIILPIMRYFKIRRAVSSYTSHI